MDEPRTGQVWKHESGGVYAIVGIARPKGDYMPSDTCVVYRSQRDGQLYVRTLINFLDKFTIVGGS